MSWFANNDVLVTVLPSFDAHNEQQSSTMSTATTREENDCKEKKNNENKRKETKEEMNEEKGKRDTKEKIEEKNDVQNEKEGNEYEKESPIKRYIKSGVQCPKKAKPSTNNSVRKWECQYCDLSCNDKSNLNRHIKRKHKDCQF